jgi:predicted regulator of Ras-like GTPase activity (Roadblock/LC7/MglB family)
LGEQLPGPDLSPDWNECPRRVEKGSSPLHNRTACCLSPLMADFGQSFQHMIFKGNFISDLTLKEPAYERRYEGALLLKQILTEFLDITGVTTAALVGRDGFIIDMAGKASLDRDVIGSLGSSSIIFSELEKGAPRLDGGNLRQMMLEYQNGAIILTPITKEEFLMVLTNTTNGLGHMAYLIATTSPRVAAAL